MTETKPELAWIDNLSKWMDSKYRIPGTDIRFGLDPVIGLVPYLGDVTSFLISAGLVLSMAKYGASRKVIILMALNVLLDAVIGSIPIIGNIFDVVYRANQRNVNLLKKHYEEGKYTGSGTGIILFVIGVLIAAFALFLYGLVKLTQWLIDVIGF